MKVIKFIARKQVVEDIASRKQTIETRNLNKFYKSRIKDVTAPFILRLRGGYNKEALFVEVLVSKITIQKANVFFRFLLGSDSKLIFELGEIVNTNVN